MRKGQAGVEGRFETGRTDWGRGGALGLRRYLLGGEGRV